MKFFLLVVCLLGVAVLAGRSSAWEVGFSAMKISPPAEMMSRVCLGGFGACPKCRQATGVHDDIYARATYYRSGNAANGETGDVVIVALDLVGVSNRFIADVLAAVERAELGVPAERIVISSTHSHSTPDLAGLWGGVSAEYRQFVVDQTAAAAVNAVRAARPARLYAGSGVFAEANNRRGWASTDREVLVLWALAVDDEQLIGVLVNFAAHPVVIGADNTLITRDWPDGLVSSLEQRLGAADRVMYVNGAQGDVSPRTGPGDDAFARSYNYGAALATAALAAMDGRREVEPDVYFDRQGFTQCITNQKFLAAAGVGCMDYNFYAGAGCPRTGALPPKKVDTQVSYLRLGRQVQIAVLPGEALTRMAVDGVGADGFQPSTGSIKGAMTAPCRGIFGLSSDFLGYFVPHDEWNSPVANKNPSNKDYEEGISLGGDDANTWIRDRVKQLIVDDDYQNDETSIPQLSWWW